MLHVFITAILYHSRLVRMQSLWSLCWNKKASAKNKLYILVTGVSIITWVKTRLTFSDWQDPLGAYQIPCWGQYKTEGLNSKAPIVSFKQFMEKWSKGICFFLLLKGNDRVKGVRSYLGLVQMIRLWPSILIISERGCLEGQTTGENIGIIEQFLLHSS